MAEGLLGERDLTAAERNAVLEMLAVIHLALRDEPAAREALDLLYGRDPDHRPTDSEASPVVQTAFARARERATPLRVSLEHTPPMLERRSSPEVRLRVTDGVDAVAGVHLAYREGSAAEFTTVVLRVDGEGAASGRVPLIGDESQPTRVEYYLEAVAPSSAVLGRSASAAAPHVIEIPPVLEAPPDLTASSSRVDLALGRSAEDDAGTSPWIWVALGGAVAVGIAVGIAVAATTGGPTDGSLGTLELP